MCVWIDYIAKALTNERTTAILFNRSTITAHSSYERAHTTIYYSLRDSDRLLLLLHLIWFGVSLVFFFRFCFALWRQTESESDLVCRIRIRYIQYCVLYTLVAGMSSVAMRAVLCCVASLCTYSRLYIKDVRFPTNHSFRVESLNRKHRVRFIRKKENKQFDVKYWRAEPAPQTPVNNKYQTNE